MFDPVRCPEPLAGSQNTGTIPASGCHIGNRTGLCIFSGLQADAADDTCLSSIFFARDAVGSLLMPLLTSHTHTHTRLLFHPEARLVLWGDCHSREGSVLGPDALKFSAPSAFGAGVCCRTVHPKTRPPSRGRKRPTPASHV